MAVLSNRPFSFKTFAICITNVHFMVMYGTSYIFSWVLKILARPNTMFLFFSKPVKPH